MSSQTIRLCSYNCRGWKSEARYVTNLLKSCDLCFIQEHWLLPDHIGALNISNDFLSIATSGMDSSELILGCPFGGCGILYRKSLAPYVSRIKCNSKRFCALYFSLCSPGNPHLNTLLINVYLPTDYGTNNAYLESLCELEGFISTHPFDNLIICGDFNVDFSRNSHNCRNLNLFMQNLNLVCPDLSSNIKYTFRRDDLTSFSWPDHVLTLGHHKHLIKGVASIDDVDNFSDHLPLVFQVDISNSLPLHTSPPCTHLPDD